MLQFRFESVKYLIIHLFCVLAGVPSVLSRTDYYDPHPFGQDTVWAKDADEVCIGQWWISKPDENHKEMREWVRSRSRDKTLAFALYTHDNGVLKLTAQCFPLLPDEPKAAVLEFKKNGYWEPDQVQSLRYPGWSLHFRVEDWDNSKDIPYRIRLGDLSSIEGLIRKDPVCKDTIVVASMNCNSPFDKSKYERTELVENIRKQDPDLLFFAGDQSYLHDEHTYGWLQFGEHYGDLMKDRPTVCITDDHDVGHGNLWGESGIVSHVSGASDGGYLYPASFVRMVERCQTWSLPDPYDARPVAQGIGVYYTDLKVGGISFAILEDRKFKSGPKGKIPQMGPRPDHILDESYDRKAIDVPGLNLLGERQLAFLDHWARDWDGAVMKAVLSQTAFCGAVHCHGSRSYRLAADLDCNGWPQTGRNKALKAIRRAHAVHLCGDQHLAVVVRHGIDNFRDGPYAFTSPALVNTIYGRWWWPESEKPGGGAAVQSTLPWVGDYVDGLGNKITMLAYANPVQTDMDELKSEKTRHNRGDGYGLVRFNKPTGKITLECWPRFADLTQGDDGQFTGWPISFNIDDNDGRKPVGYLKEVTLPAENAVVELTNTQTGELIYCYRVKGKTFKAPVYDNAKHTLKAGSEKADQVLLQEVMPQ
jgi:hypothetical protein